MSTRSTIFVLVVVFLFGVMAAVGAADMATLKALIIVTPKKFVPALQDYAKYKLQQRPTRLVTLESILKNSPGVDDPERIKRYLYREWREKNLGYVLLVGDADIMPVRYMVLDRITPAAKDYAFYPCDQYYGDLAKEDGSFDDWNANKEGFHAGYYGEVNGEAHNSGPMNVDQVHYRCEIGYGRWPVDTPREVRLVAAKTEAYEKGWKENKNPTARTAAFINPGGYVDSRGLFDELGKVLPAGWKTEKRYYADKDRNDNTPPPNDAEMIKLLNAGAGLVAHIGHGDPLAWSWCFWTGDLPQVHNADRLPVMISAGCTTAYFAALPPYQSYTDVDGKEHVGTDAGEVFSAPPPPPAPYQKGVHNPTNGLGETLLRGNMSGAVAYMGCNTGAQGPAITLIDGFVRALGKAQEPTLGDCWKEAVAYFWNNEGLATRVANGDWYSSATFFQVMKYQVFGDPSLLMPGPQVEAGITTPKD
jgi:hypothetical protein